MTKSDIFKFLQKYDKPYLWRQIDSKNYEIRIDGYWFVFDSIKGLMEILP